MVNYGFLSTYPPTRCGLATFSAALLHHLTDVPSGDICGVVEVVDRVEPDTRPDSMVRLVSGHPLSVLRTIDALNGYDVVIVQHEYGVYGGADGDEVLDVLEHVDTPAIVVLHTVLATPTPNQRLVLQRVIDSAAAVVVLSQSAAAILLDGYSINRERLHVIPHGAAPAVAPIPVLGPAQAAGHSPASISTAASTAASTSASPLTGTALSTAFSTPPAIATALSNPASAAMSAPTSAPIPGRTGRSASGRRTPTILTWGLIGPGKGIEWAVAALGHLRDLEPAPRYLIAGQTHPKVLARQGEAYRSLLQRLSHEHGVADLVEFDSVYKTPGALAAMVRRADVVLLPYESSEQVTSGVLIEAVAARRPVIATAFPHARELLAGGAGLVVPHRDPEAMAHALRRVLTEPGLADAMRARGAELAPALAWKAVAARYRVLAKSLLGSAVPTPTGVGT